MLAGCLLLSANHLDFCSLRLCRYYVRYTNIHGHFLLLSLCAFGPSPRLDLAAVFRRSGPQRWLLADLGVWVWRPIGRFHHARAGLSFAPLFVVLAFFRSRVFRAGPLHVDDPDCAIVPRSLVIRKTPAD